MIDIVIGIAHSQAASLGTHSALVLTETGTAENVGGLEIHTGRIGTSRDLPCALDASTLSPERLLKAIERDRYDIIFGFSYPSEKKTMHHPALALNQVIAKTLHAKSTITVFSPHILADARLLETAIFNAKVLRSAHVPVIFASLARTPEELCSVRDAESLAHILGYSDQERAASQHHLTTILTHAYARNFTILAER